MTDYFDTYRDNSAINDELDHIFYFLEIPLITKDTLNSKTYERILKNE